MTERLGQDRRPECVALMAHWLRTDRGGTIRTGFLTRSPAMDRQIWHELALQRSPPALDDIGKKESWPLSSLRYQLHKK